MTAQPTPIRVLIAEEEPHIRGTIRVIVETLGGRVVAEAADGETAVVRYTDVRPDVVILDINMPRLTGDKVLERLRVIDPEVRAIMMTAQDTVDSVRRCMDLGARGCVLKNNSAGDIYCLLADAWADCLFDAPLGIAA